MKTIGFSGTQEGMPREQRAQVFQYLLMFAGGDPIRLHHGDCIGADAQVHEFARSMGWEIVIHPPEDPRKRAFCEGASELRGPQPYLRRNRNIVDSAGRLLAAPNSFQEQLRSGTWSTIRYARVQEKVVTTVFPDGTSLTQMVGNLQEAEERLFKLLTEPATE